jgi:hypothetical protein
MAAVDRFHRARLTDRLPRTRRIGIAAAGIGLWGWTLFVMALGVIVWELPSFRASGEVCGCPPFRDVDLPTASHGSDLELGPMLEVRRSGEALLDGVVVRRPCEAHDHRLPAMLGHGRQRWEVLHPGEPHPGVLLVGADRGVRWGELRPLLGVARAHDYDRLHFVVMGPDDLDGFDWERFRAP